MSLYDDLGVEPTATEDEIKAAYRKKATRSHPDRGGDAAEFKKAANAFGVLSDPAKRQRYDDTGLESDDDEPGNRAAQLIVAAFRDVMMDTLRRNIDPKQPNLVALVRQRLQTDLGKNETQAKDAAEALKAMEDVRDRFSAKEGESILKKAVQHDMDGVRKQIDSCNAQVAVLTEALKMVANEQYRCDGGGFPKQSTLFRHPNNPMFGSWTTTSTEWP